MNSELAVVEEVGQGMDVWGLDGEDCGSLHLKKGHEGAVYGVAVTDDGTIVSCGWDGSLGLWAKGRQYARIKMGWTNSPPLLSVSLGNTGTNTTIAATCSARRKAGIVDLETGDVVYSTNAHLTRVNDVSLSACKHLFVTAGDDGFVRLWDTRTKSVALEINRRYPQTAVVLADDGLSVYYGGIEGIINGTRFAVTSDKQSNSILSVSAHTDTITGLSLSHDNRRLAANGMDGKISITDVLNRKVEAELAGAKHNFEKNLLRVAWSRDNRHLAAGSADQTLVIWDTHTQSIVSKMSGHTGCVNAVAFGGYADNKGENIMRAQESIVSASSDGSLILTRLNYNANKLVQT